MNLKNKRFIDIAYNLLQCRNCSMRCEFWYIQNLHRFVQTDIQIVKKCKDPANDYQCLALKKNLLYILDNYTSIKKGAPGTMIK